LDTLLLPSGTVAKQGPVGQRMAELQRWQRQFTVRSFDNSLGVAG